MRSRRGISTMVGAVFFIIAMTVAISYITYSMDTLDQFVQTVVVKSSVKEDQRNEEFEVSKLTIDSGKFNITVTNVGQIPINITRLWVENVTSGVTVADAIPKNCDIKKQLGPKQAGIKIGQSPCALSAKDAGSYQLKLVTERGTTLDFVTNAPGKEALLTSFIALPDSIPSEFTSTLFLEIINNASSHETIHNIQPSVTWISSDPLAIVTNPFTDPNPTVFDSLMYGDTATFKWVYKIDAAASETVTFNVTLAGDAENYNSHLETVTVQNVLFAQSSQTTLESESLSCCPVEPDLLVFHNEVSDTPLSEYQMSSTDAEISGSDIHLYWNNSTAGNPYDAGYADDVANARWITNNDTSTNIAALYGAWNVSLRYVSEPFPHDVFYKLEKDDEISAGKPLFFMKEMMIHHFNHPDGSPTPLLEVDSSRGDSSKKTDMVGSSMLSTDWGPIAGPHYSGAYHFTGSKHFENTDPEGQIKADGDNGQATALWFKIDGGATFDEDWVLYSATKDANEYLLIFIDHPSGNLIFDFQGSGQQTTCTDTKDYSSSTYVNNWHHVVALMEDKDSEPCELFVNGTLADTGNDITDELKAGANEVRIGAGDNGVNNFEGWIDDVITWKKNFGDLNGGLAESLSLFKTNYGNASHVLFFNITKTDYYGSGLDLINDTKAHNATLPFNDPKGGMAEDYDLLLPNPPGGTFNYTFYPITDPGWNNVTFFGDDRLKVDMWHDPDAESSTFTNLPMVLHIDDNGIAN